MLSGAGVGNANASVLYATVAWMLKDGLGMMGSLCFAFVFADVFEVNVKEWRLTADALCNIGKFFALIWRIIEALTRF
jgi:hypothetical protein